jgi:hypothetical protein
VGFLTLALSDDGFSDQYERHGFYTGCDLMELANRLNIPARPIQSFVKNIERKLPQLIETIRHSYMPDEQKTTSEKIAIDRLRALSIEVRV